MKSKAQIRVLQAANRKAHNEGTGIDTNPLTVQNSVQTTDNAPTAGNMDINAPSASQELAAGAMLDTLLKAIPETKNCTTQPFATTGHHEARNSRIHLRPHQPKGKAMNIVDIF